MFLFSPHNQAYSASKLLKGKVWGLKNFYGLNRCNVCALPLLSPTVNLRGHLKWFRCGHEDGEFHVDNLDLACTNLTGILLALHCAQRPDSGEAVLQGFREDLEDSNAKSQTQYSMVHLFLISEERAVDKLFFSA